MNEFDDHLESNVGTGADEAVQRLDQQVFQALLFNSFLNQQQHRRSSLAPSQRLVGILSLVRELPATSSTNDLLSLVTTRVVDMTGATGAAIALSEAGEMVCRASSGATAPGLGMRFSTESGLSGGCVRSGQTLICDDTECDVRVNHEASRLLSVRSLVSVPLKQDGITFGVLEIFSARSHAFESADVVTLEIIGALVSLAWGYASEKQRRESLELERSAVIEALQQITPALEAALRQQQQQQQRRPEQLSADHTPVLAVGESGSVRVNPAFIKSLARRFGVHALWDDVEETSHPTR